MALVKRVQVQVTADGTEDAKLKIDRLRVAAEELKAVHPDITPKIDSARALLEARLLREGIKRELSGSLDAGGGGIGGFFGGLLGKAGGGISSALTGAGGAIPGIGGALGSNPYVAAAGIAAVTAGAAALIPEIVGVASGFLAAAAGVGAFGLFSAGTFSQLKGDITTYQSAMDKLNNAQNLQGVAQANFKADPTKANQTALTTANRGVLNAQNNLAAAQAGMGQDAGNAAKGVSQLRLEYDKLSASTAPETFTIISDALKVANTLLPQMLPFATQAGGAIDALLGKVQAFFQSADFKKWLGQFEKLVAPSITAIGDGIGHVMTAVGKLFTLMSSKDAVNAINIAFGTIANIIQYVGDLVVWIMQTWDSFIGAVRDVRSFLDGGKGPGQSVPKANQHPMPTRAAGGVSPGGWTVVGEQGPEMVRLPQGSTVYPAGPSSQMGGTQRIILEIRGGSREFQTFLKKTIRVNGGDPAVVGR